VRTLICTLGLAGCGFELRPAGLGDDAVDAPRTDATETNDATDADPTPRSLVFRDGFDGYAGTLDSYLSDNVPGPHGAETTLIWDLSPDEEHALVQFSSLFGPGPRQIPPGSTIVAASLQIVVIEPSASIGMFREVAAAWDESTTWATFGVAAGVQPEDLGATLGPAPTTGTTVIDVTTSVAAWSANPAASFGWLFSPGGTDGCDVASSEATNPDQRPELRVTYVAP